MRRIFSSHQNSFFILSSSILMANEASDTQILGINSNGKFTFEKITKKSQIREQLWQICTSKNILYCPISARIAGTGEKFRSGAMPSATLEINDRLANYSIFLENEQMVKTISNESIEKTSILSYLCGMKCALNQKNKNHNLNSNSRFYFFNFENELIKNFVSSVHAKEFEELIQWHKDANFISKIKENVKTVYEDWTDYYKTGIIRCSIPITEFSPFYSKNEMRFCPLECRELPNIRFFLIGYITGVILNKKKIDSEPTKRWILDKNDKIKIHPITDDSLIRFLVTMMSIYGFDIEFKIMKNGELQLNFSTQALTNLLSNNLMRIEKVEKWSSIISKIKIDSDVIDFEVDTDDIMWRPIIDFTIMKFN